MQEEPKVSMLQQLEEALANGAGPSTLGRQSEKSAAATSGLAPSNADTTAGVRPATAGPAQRVSSSSMHLAAGESPDRTAASPKGPQAPSSVAPPTATVASAVPDQATQAEAVRISPGGITDSAAAVPSTVGGVEKPTSLASSSPQDTAETGSASSATQETNNNVSHSPVGVTGSRATGSSPRSSNAAGRPGAVAGGRSMATSPSALINREEAKPHANADAAEGQAAPSSPSLTSKEETVARASGCSTATHTGAGAKPAVGPRFAMTAASGDSAAASQTTFRRASIANKLALRHPDLLPPAHDQASFRFALSPAFAAGGDASFRPPPFSFAPASSGSPLAAILHRTFRSKAAAAVGLPAASGSQTAQTGTEPKPATACEESDAEEQWEVVPGAEHLKQLKDAKARWLSCGGTCTVKR